MGKLDMCCVRDCKKRRDINPYLSFFRIPSEPAARHDAWIEFTGRKSEQKNSWKVCSDHFQSGKPSKKAEDVDYIPSKDAPKKSSKATTVMKKYDETEGADTAIKVEKDDEPGSGAAVGMVAAMKAACSDSIKKESATEAMKMDEDDNVSVSSTESERRLSRKPRPSQDTLCDICGKEFPCNSKLRSHYEKHLRHGKIYKCRACNEEFRLQKALMKHERTHPELKPVRRYMCDYCGKSFHSTTNLGDHTRLHTGEHPFQCPTCGQFFMRKTDLKIHERMKHNKDNDGMHPCPECKKYFPTKHRLLAHLNKHVDEMGDLTAASIEMASIECEECGKKFFTKGRLKLHMDVHKNIVHQCDRCEKSFRHKVNLVSHIRGVHENNSKYECKYCFRKFGNTYNLRVHERIHSGEKPYTCQYCSKGYADVCNFRRHEQKCAQTKLGPSAAISKPQHQGLHQNHDFSMMALLKQNQQPLPGSHDPALLSVAAAALLKAKDATANYMFPSLNPPSKSSECHMQSTSTLETVPENNNQF